MNKLVKPYIVFSTFAVIMNALMGLITNTSIGKNLIIDVYKSVSLYGIHAIWYLPFYVIATFIVLKTDTWVKKAAAFVGGITNLNLRTLWLHMD